MSVGAITIDGTKIKADASMDQNRTYRDLVRQILREAEEIDQAEDRLHGKDRRGDELPEELRTPEGRREALAEAKRRLEERKGRPIKECATTDPEMDLEPLVLGRQVLRRGGRREWPRVARRELEAHRAQQAQPIPRDREDRLFQALGRFEQNHRIELAAHEDYDRWRASARDTKGRVLKGNSKPFTRAGAAGGRDQPLRSGRAGDAHAGHPAAAGLQRADQRERAAGDPRRGDHDRRRRLRASRADARHHPRSISSSHGVSEQPEVVLADAGYWHTRQIQSIAERGMEVLVPPDGTMRDGIRPGWEHGFFDVMRQKLLTDHGRQLYAKRKITVEPVYGQIKHNRHIDRFMRRGRAAAQSEWRLIAATHNLLKLHNHWIANPA